MVKENQGFNMVRITDCVAKDGTGIYELWLSMFNRCYREDSLSRVPSYAGCSVTGDFIYLSKFKEWCKLQKGFGNKGWQLDKDILVKGNKVYEPNTCCFVPKDLNTLFTHRRKDRGKYPVGVSYKPRIRKYVAQISRFKEVVHLGSFNTPEEAFQAYKQAKEAYIKEVAEKWKDKIDIRVYEALMKYEVNIDD